MHRNYDCPLSVRLCQSHVHVNSWNLVRDSVDMAFPPVGQGHVLKIPLPVVRKATLSEPHTQFVPRVNPEHPSMHKSDRTRRDVLSSLSECSTYLKQTWFHLGFARFIVLQIPVAQLRLLIRLAGFLCIQTKPCMCMHDIQPLLDDCTGAYCLPTGWEAMFIESCA